MITTPRAYKQELAYKILGWTGQPFSDCLTLAENAILAMEADTVGVPGARPHYLRDVIWNYLLHRFALRTDVAWGATDLVETTPP